MLLWTVYLSMLGFNAAECYVFYCKVIMQGYYIFHIYCHNIMHHLVQVLGSLGRCLVWSHCDPLDFSSSRIYNRIFKPEKQILQLTCVLFFFLLRNSLYLQKCHVLDKIIWSLSFTRPFHWVCEWGRIYSYPCQWVLFIDLPWQMEDANELTSYNDNRKPKQSEEFTYILIRKASWLPTNHSLKWEKAYWRLRIILVRYQETSTLVIYKQ